MTGYTVRQIDHDGGVISEKHVDSDNSDAALRQLKHIADTTQRIEVLDENHNRVRQISAAYWQQKSRRTKW